MTASVIDLRAERRKRERAIIRALIASVRDQDRYFEEQCAECDRLRAAIKELQDQ